MIKGIHHISMRCNDPEEFEKVKDFYLNVLGLTVKREWPGLSLCPASVPCSTPTFNCRAIPMHWSSVRNTISVA